MKNNQSIPKDINELYFTEDTEDFEIFWITQGASAFSQGFNFGKCVFIPAGEARTSWIKGYNDAEKQNI